MSEDKVRENRLRRMASRQGYMLHKSRRRDERALDYGGYVLINSDSGVVLGHTPHAYSADLDEIEHYLTDDGGEE